MRSPLVVGNWKMHGTIAEARHLAEVIRDGLKRPRGVEVAVFPPFTALPAVSVRMPPPVLVMVPFVPLSAPTGRLLLLRSSVPPVQYTGPLKPCDTRRGSQPL